MRIPCIYLAYILNSSTICIASSLVGHIINACTFLHSQSIFSKIGRPKVAVFPVPVLACPIISFPSFNKGITSFCIGVHSLYPILSIPLLRIGSIIISSIFIPLYNTIRFSDNKALNQKMR